MKAFTGVCMAVAHVPVQWGVSSLTTLTAWWLMRSLSSAAIFKLKLRNNKKRNKVLRIMFLPLTNTTNYKVTSVFEL